MLKYFVSMVLFLLLMAGCTTKVNDSIIVKEGETIHKNLYTINGNIVIGPNARVNGSCATVNGRILVKENSSVTSIKSVNGSIQIGKNCHVKKDIALINGTVEIDSLAEVKGKIGTVNGSLKARNAHLHGNLYTVNGDLFFSDHTVVDGNIIIKGKKSSGEKRKVEIFVQGGSEIKGNIQSKAMNTEVVVHVTKDSKIDGDVISAEIVYE